MVQHIGNDPEGQGGIASVIRNTLAIFSEQSSKGLLAQNLVSYNQSEPSRLRRQIYAVQTLLRFSISRRPDLVHVHLSNRGSLLREGAFLCVARLRRIRATVTVHGSGFVRPSRPTLIATALIVRCANLVHVLDKSYIVTLRLPIAKTVVVPNFVHVDTCLATDARSNTIVFVGEVGYRKGIDLLLKAWSVLEADPALKDWELTIVGPLTEFGEATIKASALDRVRLMGPRSNDDARRIIRDSQILVQPSRAEAFPISVCEALGSGCAVIGTEVGGMSSLLRESGQVCVNAEHSDLANAIRNVAANTEYRRELMRSGWKYATSHLSAEVVGALWLNLYEQQICLEPSS
ncbi:glycosyltransferase family 4 protein [Pseudonocardia alni]|uniref:glycosyltransferase family 4 protein n=1 Tax=Pseudonocardia alni TaxID=33907 RepID=UPI0031F781F7